MNQGMIRKLQKMQKDMMKAQKDLEETVFTGTAGGVVAVEVKGDKQVLSIKIEKEAVDPEDVEILQDMILAAINQAMTEIDRTTQEVMAPYTQGMPGLF
jgi:nucleoid-associated protein EbfC